MDYLRLSLALLLPWLAGYLWLAALEFRFNPRTHSTSRQIGYGLFIGYALLQGILLSGNALTGAVAFWPLLAVLALITLAGAIVFARYRPLGGTGVAAAVPVLLPLPVARILFWVVVVWSGLHLLLVATEILHRPVFPWDAWLNWIYRAKAWFHAGQIFVLDNPGDWLHGTGSALYNVAGNDYPTLPSILALWSALALGQWSETLVNLPVLFCGIALGLGLYGQCREFGLEKWLSAVAAYLLLSLPLIGAHLSLAGQADIWMAGFTGLGCVALLHGIIRDERMQILLGLGMVALGIATKAEGAVWFLAALLVLALARRTAVSLGCLALVAAAAALGWLLEITYVELPMLGGFGMTGDRIHIPLLGSYALQDFDLWDDFRDNFFAGGTWHLLWTFVVLGAISLMLLPAGMLRRTVAVFYCVLLATQLFIFEGTESGQWAEDWTAINRLPLHFAPTLIFAVLVLVQASPAGHHSAAHPGPALRAPLLGLIFTLVGAIAYLLLAYPGSDTAPQTFTARDLRIVVGSGRVGGDVGLIEQYQNNVAILSSGPVQLDTQQLGLLRVETAGSNRNRATFFWRNGSGPEDLHATEIPGRGTRWLNLDDLPEWQGKIQEIGIIFYSDRDRPVEFHRLELTGHSLPLQLIKLSHDWAETSGWSQKSVHWLPAGAVTSTVPLPLLMSAWAASAMLLTLVIARRKPGARAGALLCALATWAVLDLRWTLNSLVQAGDTVRAYPLVTAAHQDFGDDNFTRQFVDLARPEIEIGGTRTIIVGEDDSMRFEVLRAKYHALPAATYVHEGPVETAPAQIADRVLVLRKRYREPGERPTAAAEYARAIGSRTGLQVQTVWEKREGVLLSVSSGSRPHKP